MHYEIRAMSFGEILDAGFRIVRNHFKLLVGMAVILYAPLWVENAISSRLFGVSASTPSGWWIRVISILISIVLWSILPAALTLAIGELYLGRSVSLRRCLGSVARMFGPMSGTTLLALLLPALPLAALAGLALLVRSAAGPLGAVLLVLAFPVGVIAYARIYSMYLVVPQVMMLEGTFGRRALRRSRELVHGHILRGVAILLVATLIFTVLSTSLRFGLSAVPLLASMGSVLAQAVTVAYTSAVDVVFYFDLRSRKEAFDLEHLARLVEAEGGEVSSAAVYQ